MATGNALGVISRNKILKKIKSCLNFLNMTETQHASFLEGE